MSATEAHPAPADAILERARLLEALGRYLDLTYDAHLDQATGFTCTEAQAYHDLLVAAGRPGHADQYLEAHAEGDEPGDTHYQADDG